VLYFVWGSTYIGIAIAVDTIPPFLMAAIRFGLAGAFLFGWSFLRAGGTAIAPTRREWRDSLIVGGLLLGGGMGMVAFGQQTIPAGIAAVLIAMLPLWIAVLGRLFLGERLPRLAVVGIVVGFVGVAVLVGPTVTGESGALEPLGLAAIILSPISWATGSLFASHRARLPRLPLVASAAQMVTGAAILTAMGVASGELGRFDPAAIAPDSLAALAYLTVIGSLVGFSVYGWLLRSAPLPLIATYAYVNPVVAVILGALILRETIEPRTLVAGAVIIGAVALIVTARGRMRPPAPAVAGDAAPVPATPAIGSPAADRAG
jgi:drug/metabolite transporter (DMT)-like permease